MHPRLLRRTVAFARVAHRVTKDPDWLLVARFESGETLERVCLTNTPQWVRLALAAHKVRSASDARRVLFDLALPSNSLPLFVLSAHSIAFYSLASLLRPLTSRVLALPTHSHASFHFNSLLQAISLFDRSRTAADAAVDILKEMDRRKLPLWQNTEKALIRDNFRSSHLLDYLCRRDPERQSEARLRAYASMGKVPPSAHYLHAVRQHCLDNDVPAPYTALVDGDDDVQGTAHKANTQYLRAMRDDRRSAFRYFHRLLKLDLTKPSVLSKNIDIYDWTTALYAAAHDKSLSASSLLDLFHATRDGTSAYKPTRATYTVLIQGLLWRNALEDAQKLWDQFVHEVIDARDEGKEAHQMRIDRKALCVGIDVLVQSGRTEEALYLLDEAVKRDMEPTSPGYLNVHPIHALLSALLRIRRPDVVFYVWTHLTTLYSVPPTNLMLRLLLKAAMQASKMDGESVKGTVSWYMADNRLFKKRAGQKDDSSDPIPDTGVPSRDTLVASLHALVQTTPSVIGIWANRRSTEVARSIFRDMIFGNWPTLRHADGPFGLGGGGGGGVTNARAKGGESVLQEFVRVFATRRTDATMPLEDDVDGPPLPTVMPSESTFSTYVALLGLSSRADEIPEALGWMRALNVSPKRETLAVALVFWMEVGLRGPMFEDGWTPGSARTEYGALRAWIREWVGEKRAPTEEDIYAGIKRVKEMRRRHVTT